MRHTDQPTKPAGACRELPANYRRSTQERIGYELRDVCALEVGTGAAAQPRTVDQIELGNLR
jgi:hypothetical protein